MPAEPSVTFVGHGAERSGPPVHLLRFQRWLRSADGPRPAISTLLVRGGALLPDFAALGDVVVLDDRWTGPRIGQAAAGRVWGARAHGRARDARYRARLRSTPPTDLVYLNSASAGSIHAVRALGPAAGRLVTHVHELNVGLGYHLDDEERAFLFSRTTHFLAVSGAVRDELEGRYGVSPGRITLAPGFVVPGPPPDPARVTALRDRLGIPPDAPVVGASGMTDWRKAPDLFLRLAWEQRRRAPDLDCHYVWVGGDVDGPNWWPLDHDRRHLGLEGRVHLLGALERPEEAFAACDVFALTAREDAYPLACLEAGLLGVPCVTFANGGLPELLTDVGGGSVVDYGDTGALADALVALLRDPDERRAAGRRLAAAVAARHDVAVAAPSVWEELRRLAAG